MPRVGCAGAYIDDVGAIVERPFERGNELIDGRENAAVEDFHHKDSGRRRFFMDSGGCCRSVPQPIRVVIRLGPITKNLYAAEDIADKWMSKVDAAVDNGDPAGGDGKKCGHRFRGKGKANAAC